MMGQYPNPKIFLLFYLGFLRVSEKKERKGMFDSGEGINEVHDADIFFVISIMNVGVAGYQDCYIKKNGQDLFIRGEKYAAILL